MINFAAAALPHELTSYAPFQIEFGYEPRTSFDWRSQVGPSMTPTERLSRDQARQLVTRMEEVWKFARSSLQKAQEKQKKQADKHRREVDFEVGDLV